MPTPRLLAPCLVALLTLFGCGGHDHHDHDHGDHDHDHDHGHEHDDHGHSHAAPHGGALAELGDHVGHVEFVLDPATGELTLYVLDSGAENGVRSASESVDVDVTAGDASFTVSLASQANALSGETVGDSSVFAGTHEALVGRETFTAVIGALEFKGATFTDVAVPYPQGAEE